MHPPTRALRPCPRPSVCAVFCAVLVLVFGVMLVSCESGDVTTSTTVSSSTSTPSLGQSTTTTSSTMTAEVDLTAHDPSAEESYAALKDGDPFLLPKYDLGVQLAVANGPGRPGVGGASSLAAIPVAASMGVKVDSPIEGEVLLAGSKYVVRWTFTGPAATFKLLISTDNGATYTPVTSDLTAQELEVTVPKQAHAQCYYRVDAATIADPDSDAGSILFSAVSGRFSISLTPPGSVPRKPNTKIPPIGPAKDLAYVMAATPFVNKLGDGTRWFKVGQVDPGASKLVWQLSSVPFSGRNEDALDPPGLIASGELAPGQTEFSVDFNKVAADLAGGSSISGAGAHLAALLPSAVRFGLPVADRYTFAVRVIALDAAGKLIRDAGRGLAIRYGSPSLQVVTGSLVDIVPPPGVIQVWTSQNGTPTDGSYGYPYVHQVKKGIWAFKDDKFWDFEWRSLPAGTIRAKIQVTTVPFDKKTATSYEHPAGMVWPSKPPFQYYGIIPVNGLRMRIPLSEFTAQAGGTITKPTCFYVRLVCFVPGDDPGVERPVASETQKLYYVNTLSPAEFQFGESPASVRPTETITVKSGVPFTTFSYYKPATWEAPDAKKWFEVSRRILADEMVLTVKTPSGTILPWGATQFLNPMMTKEQYQALLDKVLPVGTYFPLTVTTDAWNDFLDLLGAAWGQFRDAYSGMQTTVASYVADNFPGLDDDQREALRSALETVIAVGLTALGLPPELPDFQRLAQDGFNYALQVALDQACKELGIKPSEIPAAVKDQVTKDYSAKLASMVKPENLNPLGVGYLKPAAAKNFGPGCAYVLVQNFSDTWSPRGTLTVYGATVKTIWSMHYNIYKNADLPIPSLAPGTHMVIPVYLTPDIPVPGTNHGTIDDYEGVFFGSVGPSVFTVTATYDIPDGATLAKQQGLIPKNPSPLLNYAYDYDHSPTYQFSWEGLPSEWKTGGDPDANPLDFAK